MGERRIGVEMIWKRCSAFALVIAAAAAGCDDRSTSRSTSRPASYPDARAAVHAARPAGGEAPDPADARAQTASAVQTATRPAQTQPAAAFLTVDGQIVQFPSARLRLSRTGEGLRALLFSNDPKEAMAGDYQGNSFYFDFPLKIADPKDLADAEYAFKAPTSETEGDSPNGVFLHGMRTHLQPQDIAISFDGESPQVIARVAGRFLVVNTTGDATPGQFASITGTLFVSPEVKGE
jgi:hypothetical protein